MRIICDLLQQIPHSSQETLDFMFERAKVVKISSLSQFFFWQLHKYMNSPCKCYHVFTVTPCPFIPVTQSALSVVVPVLVNDTLSVSWVKPKEELFLTPLTLYSPFKYLQNPSSSIHHTAAFHSPPSSFFKPFTEVYSMHTKKQR